MSTTNTARIAFADGTIFRGRSVGAEGTVGGEGVFNTGMTGYQEVLTDPSYTGQIVTMTYPLIGNYGINADDMESAKAHVAGLVMRQCCTVPSNFRAQESLPDFLRRQNIVAIDDVDTRAITRALRLGGAMNAVITTHDLSDAELLANVRAVPSMNGLDLASRVTCAASYSWDEPSDPTRFGSAVTWDKLANEPLVVVIDCGIKRNILRLLRTCGFRVEVVPSMTTAAAILARKPAGIFISNGPGDPAATVATINAVKELITADVPLFGICLGHQIMALAHGASTYKLKFGHRGANHPIQRVADGAVEIASHNHGFAVDPASLPATMRMSHINLNDNTCAGIEHLTKRQFSVQYHPEAGPGPADPLYLFKRFADDVRHHAA